MENILKKAFVITLCLLSVFTSYAQQDTRGTDFWLAFGTNGNIDPHTLVDLQIRIASTQGTSGTIYFTHLNRYVPIQVSPGIVATYAIRSIQNNNDLRDAVYVQNAGTTNKSIRIQPDNPVTVYAFNQTTNFSDATNVLPATALGTEYYQVQHTPSVLAQRRSGYIIIATEDDTEIFHGGSRLVLNAGQVHHRYTTTDLTGTHISSDKPIAVFNTQVTTGSGLSIGADHLFQQLPPVHTWGTNFLVPVTIRNRERVRIVASHDGTDITQTGGTLIASPGGQTTLTNLNAGQWVELEITRANGGAFISANYPIAVCSFLMGDAETGISSLSGSPAMAWVPPMEQMMSRGTVAPFIATDGGGITTRINRHYAVIVSPTATKNNTTVRIGGTEQPTNPLSGGTWVDNAASGMSFYNVQFSNVAESRTYANPAGLFIMGYGLSSLQQSYYYLAASAMRNLTSSFSVNGISTHELGDHSFIVNKINFQANIQGDISTEPGHIRWFINGVEEINFRDHLSWSKTLRNGIYTVVMEALMEDGTPKHLETTVIVAAPIVRINPHIRTVVRPPNPCEDLIGVDCSVAPTGGRLTAFTNVMYDFQTQTLTHYGSNGNAIFYQWQMSKDSGTNWQDIAGASSSTFVITPDFIAANTMDNTSIRFRCVLSNPAGKADSNPIDILFIHTNTSGYSTDANGVRYLTIQRGGSLNGGKMKIALLNLGATEDADSLIGDFYQWGRVDDGHQRIVWSKQQISPLGGSAMDTGVTQPVVLPTLDYYPYMANWLGLRSGWGAANTTSAVVARAANASHIDVNTGQVYHPDDNPAGEGFYGKFVTGSDTAWGHSTLSVDGDLWGNQYNTRSGSPVDISGWTEKAQKNNPCPPGWRVPSRYDFIDIYRGNGTDYSGVAINISTSAAYDDVSASVNKWRWHHTDSYAIGGVIIINSDNEKVFLPAAGVRLDANGRLNSVGARGLYWSSTYQHQGGYGANALFVSHSSLEIPFNQSPRVGFGMSVRCVSE